MRGHVSAAAVLRNLHEIIGKFPFFDDGETIPIETRHTTPQLIFYHVLPGVAATAAASALEIRRLI